MEWKLKNPKLLISTVLAILIAIYPVRKFITLPEKKLFGCQATLIKLKDQENVTGIEEINLTLHNKRLNRIHQRRNQDLLHKTPELFGENKAFKPFLRIIATGPGALYIKGNGPTKPFQVPLPKGKWKILTYPEFHLDQLYTGYPGQQETIKVYFKHPWGKTDLVDTIETEWSGPNDLFLSTDNLHDCAALLQTNKTIDNNQKKAPPNPPQWVQAMGQKIRDENIRYEHDVPEMEGNGLGWQTIRTPSSLLEVKKANCIDISLYITQQALNNQLKPYLITNSGHSVCAVASQDESLQNAYAIDGTDFLRRPLKPNKPGNPPEEYGWNETFPTPKRTNPPKAKPPQDIFQTDIKFWLPFYRPPKTQNPNTFEKITLNSTPCFDTRYKNPWKRSNAHHPC